MRITVLFPITLLARIRQHHLSPSFDVHVSLSAIMRPSHVTSMSTSRSPTDGQRPAVGRRALRMHAQPCVASTTCTCATLLYYRSLCSTALIYITSNITSPSCPLPSPKSSLPTTTWYLTHIASPPPLHLPHPHHDHVVDRGPDQSSFGLGPGTLEYTSTSPTDKLTYDTRSITSWVHAQAEILGQERACAD